MSDDKDEKVYELTGEMLELLNTMEKDNISISEAKKRILSGFTRWSLGGHPKLDTVKEDIEKKAVERFKSILLSDEVVDVVGKKAWSLAVGEGQMVGSFEEQEKFWNGVGKQVIRAAIKKAEENAHLKTEGMK